MMQLHNDEELSRLAEADDADERDRDAADAIDPIAGSVAFVGKTVSDGSYPTTAGVFFKVQVLTVLGDEAEGGAVTKTPDDGNFRYAAHLGATAPPLGTEVICVSVPDRWAFRYG